MNGHPLVPTGIVPRVNATPAAPEATPPSRAAQAIEQLLEIERKAKAFDDLRAAAAAGRQLFTAEDMDVFLNGVRL